MAADPNRQMFEWVVKLLRPLLSDLVFVGGCTTGLLLTDSAAGGIRPTMRLSTLRRTRDTRRFPSVFETSASRRTRQKAHRFAAGVLATKLEAFRGRGAGDVTLSHDLEDIVSVIDGRPEIVEEAAYAAGDVRRFIASQLSTLMANMEFREALSGFLLPDAASQARRRLLEARLEAIASLS
jgi:hypothetical protein